MPSHIRFGIIGLDHWYAAIPFAERMATSDQTELVRIVDRAAGRADEIGRRTGCEQTSTDPDAIIDDPGIDVVACFTSVEQNADLCIRAARAGKHIVSVKPVAMSLPEADRVVDAIEDSGVTFVPSESRRRSPLARRLSDLIHTGRIGELRSATFGMHSGVPRGWPGGTDPGWWVDPGRAPGGGWIDHAVYHLDRMQWLFDSDVTEISGAVANIARPDLAVEDYGHAVLRLGSGAVVTIEDTWIAAPGASSNSGFILGSQGSVQWDSTTGLFGTAYAGDEWNFTRMPTDTSDSFDTIVAAIQDGDQPSATVRTARNTLRLCLDFYRAAGKPVTVDEVA